MLEAAAPCDVATYLKAPGTCLALLKIDQYVQNGYDLQ